MTRKRSAQSVVVRGQNAQFDADGLPERGSGEEGRKAALCYISEMVGELCDIADAAGEIFLAYLLDMAREEARIKLSPSAGELVEDRAARSDDRDDG